MYKILFKMTRGQQFICTKIAYILIHVLILKSLLICFLKDFIRLQKIEMFLFVNEKTF